MGWFKCVLLLCFQVAMWYASLSRKGTVFSPAPWNTPKNIITAAHNPLAYLHLDFLSAAPHILALLTHSYCGWVPLTVLDQPQTYPPAQHPGQYIPAWERGKKFCIWYSISPPSHFLSNCSIAFSSQCCIYMNVWNLHKSSSCRKQHSFSLQM